MVLADPVADDDLSDIQRLLEAAHPTSPRSGVFLFMTGIHWPEAKIMLSAKDIST